MSNTCMPPLRQLGLAALCLFAVAAACREAPPPVTVFAAASLTASFTALAAGFEANHPGQHVQLHFAGTPRLVLQLREGAAADAFASADTANMDKVVALGRTAGAPVPFARNQLVIVTEKGNPQHIAALADLARADLRVLLCGPEVPAGRYARQALQRAGVAVQSASDEPSVQAVLAKLQLGEADAGIVYVTDAAAAAAKLDAVPIAAAHNVVATYPIAALGPRGEAFVAFVASPAGQAVLRRFGFSPP